MDQRVAALQEALDAEPGIHITEIRHYDDTYVLRGLRDPLATTVTDIAASVGVSADSIDASLQPFQSLEPELIETRVQRMFGDADVTFEVDGETLIVAGEASAAWRQEFLARSAQITGIGAVDTSGLADTTLADIRARVAELDNRSFRFTDGTDFVEGDVDALQQHAMSLADLHADAASVGHALVVTVSGATDATGTVTTNLPLAQRRAQAVATILRESGLVVDIGQPSVPEGSDGAGISQGDRQANISLRLQAPELP